MVTAKKTTSSAPSSRAAKNVKKQIRKLSTGISVALIAILIFSMAAGAGIAYLLTRNDVFPWTRMPLSFSKRETW